MRRKVNLVGENTLTVSLPSKWINKTGLKKGDELDIDESEDKLIISAVTKSKFKARKAQLNIKGFNTLLLNRFLDEFYRSGIEEIELINTPDQIYFYMTREYLNFQSYLNGVVNRYIGMEIMQKSNEKVLIQFLVKECEHEKMESINLRVYFLIKEMIHEFQEGLKNRANLVKKAHEYHESITRLLLYYSRLLNYSNISQDKKLRLFQFFSVLDILVGKIRQISQKVMETKNISTKTLSFLKDIFVLFEEQLDIVYKKTNTIRVEELIKDRYSLVNTLDSQKFTETDWKIISESKIFLDMINYFCLTYISTHLEEYVEKN